MFPSHPPALQTLGPVSDMGPNRNYLASAHDSLWRNLYNKLQILYYSQCFVFFAQNLIDTLIKYEISIL